jgi:16S rRNA (guanine1207-N2)-methyltransferase
MHETGHSHYFDQNPAAASLPRIVRVDVDGRTLELVTDRGVFSGRRIDPGTRLLLEKGPLPAAPGEVLDLGCGYGLIAVTLGVRLPNCRIWAVDVNSRALELTRANARAAGLDNVRVADPSEVPDDVLFAAIFSNPPMRIGLARLRALLTTWLRRLEVGGAATLVISRHLGADSLARWLDAEGFTTERLASRTGYRLLRVGANRE